MTTKTSLDAVIAAQNDNGAEFKSIIGELLKDRINDAVGIKKFEVASSFFQEEEEEDITEADVDKAKIQKQIAQAEKHLKSFGGNTSHVRMKAFAIKKRIDKLKAQLEEVEIAEVAGNDAADLTPKKVPDPKKTFEPQAKGEKDFVSKHKMTHTKHPVAGDHQFNGDRSAIPEEVDFSVQEAATVIDTLRNMKGGQIKVKFASGESELIDKGTAQAVVNGFKKLKGAQQKKFGELLGKSPDTFFRLLDTLLN